HAVGDCAREPDQPVPVQQGSRRKRAGEGAGEVRWLAAAALLLSGCASNGDPRDPLEGLNRFTYGVNDKVDTYAFRPVARVYRDYVHSEIRDRVRNFFANIADPLIGVNNILQGKFEDGFLDWMRFAFNSTVGLFGLHDVASEMGYEKH